VKLLTDLQILDCELHRNAFGGRAPPGPIGGRAEGAVALPRPRTDIKGRGGGKEEERAVHREGKGREGKDVKG